MRSPNLASSVRQVFTGEQMLRGGRFIDGEARLITHNTEEVKEEPSSPIFMSSACDDSPLEDKISPQTDGSTELLLEIPSDVENINLSPGPGQHTAGSSIGALSAFNSCCSKQVDFERVGFDCESIVKEKILADALLQKTELEDALVVYYSVYEKICGLEEAGASSVGVSTTSADGINVDTAYKIQVIFQIISCFIVKKDVAEARTWLETAKEILDESNALLTPKRKLVVSRGHLYRAEGRILIIEGQLDEAEDKLMTALHIFEERFGFSNEESTESAFDLVNLHLMRGQLVDADRFSSKASSGKGGRRQILRTADTLMKFSTVYLAKSSDRSDSEIASKNLRRALAIKEAVLGPNDVQVAEILNRIANLRAIEGFNDTETLAIYVRSLSIYVNHYGKDGHADVATVLSNIGRTFFVRNQLDKAIFFQKKALGMRRRVLGEFHPDVAHSLHNMATVHMQSGDFTSAETLLNKSLSILHSAEKHDDVARTRIELARCKRLKKQNRDQCQTCAIF